MLRLPRHHVGSEPRRLALLTGLAALLYLAGGVGMGYVAGFEAVRRTLERPDWPWLAASCGAVLLAFAGYYFAYRGVGRVEGGAEDLDARSRLAVVTAGFGGFLAHGGAGLDELVMRAAGASEREAKVRVALLGFFEHGILAIPCSAAAIGLLVAGHDKPPHDFTLPWAIIPGIGFAAGIWAAERYRGRFREEDGWRGRLGIALDATHLVGALLRHPVRCAPALGGMLLFWLCDMFGLWAAMAAFGFRMNAGSEIVAFGTAMIVTRRTGPLGGAGILMVALPPTLWISSAPWAPAVLGTFAYRFFTLWVPLPFSFLALPRLRRLTQSSHEVEPRELTAAAT
jgi:uncharacterized membrane protein YbhN (UPF0104 family)